MHVRQLAILRLILLHLCCLLVPALTWSQALTPQSRITQTVNDTALITLKGNTHPLAQAQFDRGAAPPDLPMARMLLVLKRSAGQEATLQKLLDDQQDRSSPSYHQWLTPDVFGQQFGLSDQDLQTVTSWLQSQGFQANRVSRGRVAIEFSGTASQVLQAFHTGIHKYAVNGEDHWANASDPRIPEALSPVVGGVISLHNFPKKPMHYVTGAFSKSKITGITRQVQVLNPDYSFSDSSRCAISGNCYFVGPYDFAKIYNVLPLWNESPAVDGTGQSIAIVGVSNINIQDVRDFRNLFGLPANDPQIIVDGIDPGLVSGAETEAVLDVEWAGAVAKGATIKLVPSASTNAIDGVNLSALYVVENNLAPIVSESFGECELFLGTAGNAFENAIRQQAAAEGITFINSAGDEGSARCDEFSGTLPAPATHGLAVSGLASSPDDVAVGGSDFENFGPNFNVGVASPYWSLTNDLNQASALGYIPETTWNSTCTNAVFVTLGGGGNAESTCNGSRASNFVDTIAGGGGKSNCTTSDGASTFSCTGGYAKPSWQSAPGVPADGKRDIPDVSLFASPGFMDSAYIICEADRLPGSPSCNLNSLDNTFLGAGGTSFAAPAFAGIMALVNQFTRSAGQGNANYVLYKLASLQSQKILNCNASGAPASGCIFNDVVAGTIAVPCAKNSPDCSVTNGADTLGVLSGYSAGVGYDLATGLGSVNAYNLVHGWTQPGISTNTTLSLNNGTPVSITHGGSVGVNITVSPQAATGDVSLIGSPNGSDSVAMGGFTLQNGAASGNVTSLAGGSSYQIRAHYAGDATYAASDSTPVTVTVAPEPSKLLITVPVFDPKTGVETGNSPVSVVYGTPLGVRVDVGNSQATVTFPPQPVCAPLACPTGNVTLTDTLNGNTSTLSPAGGSALNSGGFVQDNRISILSGGTHQLTASYPGDNSYMSSMGNYALTVAPALMQLSILAIPASPPIVGVAVNMYATFSTANSFPGAGPTGTITFYDGSAQIPGTVTYGNGQPGSTNSAASLTGYVTAAFATIGTHQISAKYSGDPDYAPASGSATSAPAVYGTSVVAKANPTALNLGQSVNITVTVAGASKTPPMTGTFQFTGQFTGLASPVTPTPGTDANGNQTLTATVRVTPQTSTAIYVYYPGDTIYASAETAVPVTVNIPDFSLNVPSSPLLISAGQPASIEVTVVPASNLPSTVSLSCGGMAAGELPGGYNCAFSPATVNLSNGASTTSTFTLAPNVHTAPAMANPAAIATRAGLIIEHPGSVNGVLLLSGLLAVTLLVWPVKWGNRRMRTGIFIFGVICLAVGCGSASGGGGGGPAPSPQPTTMTVKTNATKAAYSTPLTFTATVNSSNNATGSVLFYLNGNFSGSANLVGNTAVVSGEIPWMGIYVLTTQYTGDAANNPSTSPGVNLAVTGTSNIGIQGVTSTTNHFNAVTYTIQ